MLNDYIFAKRSSNQFLHLDKPLLIGLLSLYGLGLFVLYSAGGQDLDLIGRQLLRMAMGFGLMVLLAQLPTQHIIRWVPWIYLSGVLLLIAVLIIGEISKGSQRWLNFGVVRFQPSEVMKLAVPMMVAWYLSNSPLPPNYSRLLVAVIIVIIPVALVAEQPDLGTALLIAAGGISVIWLAGISWYFLGGLSLFGAILVPILWHMLHDYQRRRVYTFLNPEEDPLGAGYHIIQSQIAIGSGGIYGKGWLKGTQSHLEFLPERSTDFIFAVYGEELGLIGIFVLLSIYIFILTRSAYIAANAQGTFARLFGGSLLLTFFVYIFVNIGMVIGLLPVVGLPLPLISYGGTSLVTIMAAFGLLMGIHTHKRWT